MGYARAATFHGESGAPEGDIAGYESSVSDPNFNLPLFFVMLVTGVARGDVQARHYLFERGSRDYFELDQAHVRIVDKRSSLEGIISEFERRSLSRRAATSVRQAP